MTLVTSTSRWPRAVLESGPAQAGFQRGDALLMTPDEVLHLAPLYWTRTRLILVGQTHDSAGSSQVSCWRYSAAAHRFETISSWRGEWRHDESREIRVGFESTRAPERWIWKLVDDGPAVSALRHFGEHRCVNPRRLG